MIFIGGINDRHKKIKNIKYSCECKEEESVLFLEERTFSLFFLPIFSWNKKYYIECMKCHSLFQLKEECVEEVVKLEKVDKKHLKALHINRICKICGKKLEGNYEYCPYCGNKNKE